MTTIAAAMHRTDGELQARLPLRRGRSLGPVGECVHDSMVPVDSHPNGITRRDAFGSLHLDFAMRCAGVVGGQPADGGPIEMVSTLRKETQETIMQQTSQRHGHPETLGGGQRKT